MDAKQFSSLQDQRNAFVVPRTRSIEESIKHGDDAIRRATNAVRQLLNDLNGSAEVNSAGDLDQRTGLIHEADSMASRAESLLSDINRLRDKVFGQDVTKTQTTAIYVAGADLPGARYL